jgi:hypothetical protein
MNPCAKCQHRNVAEACRTCASSPAARAALRRVAKLEGLIVRSQETMGGPTPELAGVPNYRAQCAWDAIEAEAARIAKRKAAK